MTEKEKQINAAVMKLNKIFKDIPDANKKLVAGLIQNAAFMEITLLDLQKEVLENGAMLPCKSGNGFDTIKDNPAQKAYTTMISRYSGVIGQLSSLLPEEKNNNAKAGEALAAFVAKGKPKINLDEFH